MADEIIGGIGVTISGNISPLVDAFGRAQSAATQAGAQIAASFNTGAAGVETYTEATNRLIKAIQEESAAASLAAQRNAAMGKSIQQLGQNSQQAGFSVRYAFLGIKDLAEGRTTFALAEAANELNRMGGAALIAGGAIGALVAAGYGIYKLQEYTRGLAEATVAAAAPFRALNNELQETNDTMRVSNDKLSD